jgi:hypothetical protein
VVTKEQVISKMISCQIFNDVGHLATSLSCKGCQAGISSQVSHIDWLARVQNASIRNGTTCL